MMMKYFLCFSSHRGGVSSSQATCISDLFTVYSPKTFPGVTESTDLLKCFARQGLQIHIRDGRGSTGSGNSEDTVEEVR